MVCWLTAPSHSLPQHIIFALVLSFSTDVVLTLSIDFSSMEFCGICLTIILQGLLKISIHKMIMKISFLKLLPHLPRKNESTDLLHAAILITSLQFFNSYMTVTPSTFLFHGIGLQNDLMNHYLREKTNLQITKKTEGLLTSLLHSLFN